MVCLNKNISFRKLKLRDNLIKEVIDEFDRKFYLYDGNGLEKIDENEKIKLTISIASDVKKIIKNRIKDLFSDNHFLYINMNNNVCTHMFKKGKNEGYFCHKNITSNGNKENYVCTIHNKDHIPKKRIIKDIKNTTENTFNNKKIIKNNPSRIKKINKVFKRKIEKKNSFKIFIGNTGLINFSEIFKNILK